MTLENNYDIKSLTTPAATGGTVTTSGNYRIHTFTSSETFIVNKSMNVEYLVVAGGGGGGGTIGGGGGAGGLIYNPSYPLSAGAIGVTVGTGGTGGKGHPSGGYAIKGGNSTFSGITAIGGGAIGVDLSGGSGAGGGYSAIVTGGAGTVGQGNAGGNSTDPGNQGAGGGGAGGVGGSKNGGIGSVYTISGSPVTYAAGGGGGTRNGHGVAGIGGSGIGGNGTTTTSRAGDGMANTGSGGGGAGYNSDSLAQYGGNGGSGIVIISYLLSEDLIPANVTATNMSITTTDSPCRVGICTINVSVTWTNTGEISGSFTPSITVSSGTVTEVYPSEQLAPGAPVIHTFTVSGMTAGTCSICPNPN